MKNKKAGFILLIAFVVLNSCLVTLAPKYHYFVSTDSIEKGVPKVIIFSTPRFKNYVVTNVDVNTEVFINSPAFPNPDEFYLMKNQGFSGKDAKQYELARRDNKFYRSSEYKNITLKMISGENEKTITYKIIEK